MVCVDVPKLDSSYPVQPRLWKLLDARMCRESATKKIPADAFARRQLTLFENIAGTLAEWQPDVIVLEEPADISANWAKKKGPGAGLGRTTAFALGRSYALALSAAYAWPHFSPGYLTDWEAVETTEIHSYLVNGFKRTTTRGTARQGWYPRDGGRAMEKEQVLRLLTLRAGEMGRYTGPQGVPVPLTEDELMAFGVLCFHIGNVRSSRPCPRCAGTGTSENNAICGLCGGSGKL
jgi:hypothetical protein